MKQEFKVIVESAERTVWHVLAESKEEAKEHYEKLGHVWDSYSSGGEVVAVYSGEASEKF
jgi:hypothetical protein